jgi:hypothetical protein
MCWHSVTPRMRPFARAPNARAPNARARRGLHPPAAGFRKTSEKAVPRECLESAYRASGHDAHGVKPHQLMTPRVARGPLRLSQVDPTEIAGCDGRRIDA